MLSDKENDFCVANQWSKSVSYLSCFFWIINTITDDNNSRVSYAFHSFLFATKNGLQFNLKFFTLFLILHIFLVLLVSTLQPMLMLVSYDLNSSHVPSKNAWGISFLCKSSLFFSRFLLSSNASPWSLQSVFFLFFDSTNSERCFTIF